MAVVAADAVLVAGESLVDVVVGPDGRTIESAPGGAPLNIAVGLARLGVAAHLLTWFGRDEHGERIAAHLGESGVTLHDGSREAPRTSVARALLDAEHQATYEFELVWDPPAATLPAGCRAVHVGSLGTVTHPGAARIDGLAERAREAGLVVSYDPNVRPAVLADVDDPWRDVRDHAAGASLVKMSDQDAEHLQPGRAYDDLLDELLEGRHTRLAVITLGARGLRLATARHRVDVPAVPVQVVDTVGAGDACMSALLAGLSEQGLLDTGSLGALTEPDLVALGSAAAAVAAVTCARRGANPPWRRELDAGLFRAPTR